MRLYLNMNRQVDIAWQTERKEWGLCVILLSNIWSSQIPLTFKTHAISFN